MKKNIAIFLPTLGTGGAEKQALILANILSEMYKVILISYYDDQNENCNISKYIESSDIDIYRLKGGHINKLSCLYSILKLRSIDCLFNYLSFCDFFGSIIGRISNVPQIYNGIRNTKVSKYKLILERISHNLIASGTIFNCHSGLKEFTSCGFKINKCKTIVNCFPKISPFIKRNNNSIKKIITVGRFVDQKDYESAIKVIAKVKEKRLDFQFYIVGYGNEENKIRNWINQYGISDIVNIYIKPENVQELLQDSDIYLSTSLFEGTSNSIMEAMNWGLPIVCTNVGDNNFLVKDKCSGFIHECGDIDNMADSLNYLLNNYDKRIEMGKCSNEILRNSYSQDKFKSEYINLIEQL